MSIQAEVGSSEYWWFLTILKKIFQVSELYMSIFLCDNILVWLFYICRSKGFLVFRVVLLVIYAWPGVLPQLGDLTLQQHACKYKC